ncbi:LysE family translocator [Solitalea koreensis]|uniref:Threonine/homoserine/homoserine lactone efflux protein n=1 Tax=Solitalea koreensis TaxID=543615 RepID=A0A521D1I7_9SPHI|nr:LysE family transporter [Solitalea koreensis]SMO65538.1 Threonine/homoserine/homoserine lactone efflux protein [Solitalea koreensis]
MLTAIATGIIVGFILSLLTGPTFFSLLKISISRGFRSGIYFSFGVFLGDLIYISLAVIFSILVAFEDQYRQLISIVGGLFLLGIGLYYIIRKVTISNEPTKILRNTAYFFKGFLMCVLNPIMLLYWITIATKFTESYNQTELIGFLGATSITILSSDVSKSYFVSKYRSHINENHILWLNRVAGVVIIGYAVFRLLIPVILKHV